MAPLLGQRFAGLLGDHVGGVPVGPVFVAMAETFLVLAVGGFCAAKGACQVACGVEGSHARSKTPGEPSGSVLQLPAIAVGITE